MGFVYELLDKQLTHNTHTHTPALKAKLLTHDIHKIAPDITVELHSLSNNVTCIVMLARENIYSNRSVKSKAQDLVKSRLETYCKGLLTNSAFGAYKCCGFTHQV